MTYDVSLIKEGKEFPSPTAIHGMGYGAKTFEWARQFIYSSYEMPFDEVEEKPKEESKVETISKEENKDSNLITEKQFKLLESLHKELDMPFKVTKNWTKKQASKKIEELNSIKKNYLM